ncbi:MAG: hypothetical protein LBV43_01265 [Prevotella sp.]|jgi:hypothetical protein|nr:hypothetical protein [Prevotella sp.]
MKKAICLYILCFISTTILFSQESDEKKSIFQVSLVPPIGTNGRQDKDYTNYVSLNILVGRSQSEKILTLGGVANVIGHGATGVQLAGLANVIGIESNGVQVAGLANVTGAYAKGIQLAGLANVTGSGADGLQLAGLANVTGNHTRGIQIGGLANVTGNGIKGIQIAGLANVNGNDARGLNIGGIANIVGTNGKGTLLAGIANIATNYSGWKIAGIMNVTANMHGVQLAGVMNRAGNIKGAQIAGVVNKAKKVEGVQVAGLVNIADESDYPIGLVNLIKNGEKSIGITYNELGSTTVAFRSGGRVLYGIVGVGYNYRSVSKESFVVEGGIGAHINIAPVFRINTEAKASYLSIFSKKQTSQYSISIMPAYKFASNFEVFAGPSINYLYSDNPDNIDLFPNHDIWKEYKNNDFKQVYLGFTVGVQYIL